MPAVDFDVVVGEFVRRRVERRQVQSLKNSPRDGVGERLDVVEAPHHGPLSG